IPVSGIGESAKKWVIWQWFFHHLNLLFSTDIIHIHDVFFWILAFRAFLIHPKIFITFHGYEGSGPPGQKQIFWHKLAGFLTRGNICIGDFHKKWYKVNPTFVSYGAA
ncbi:MAG: glycosyltransferase, group 1 family protein, partial [Microgenomates group bacterium Gr01-1014_16]